MILAIAATLAGLLILAWSADRFVMAAAAVSKYLGLAPLLIGMLVIGFGTSAPELVVSGLAAAGGNPEIALGNAFGSNVANIGLVLGLTAIVMPVMVQRGVVRREFPVLLIVTALAVLLLLDLNLSRTDAVILVVALAVVITAGIVYGRKVGDDALGAEADAETAARHLSRKQAWLWLIAGLVVLVLSSRLLVWGAVGIAERLGWPDLVIGLTIVAIGTSAPELASAIAAARKGEGDLVLGNVLGSNIFNTLGVVGLAGLIAPSAVSEAVLTRDLPVMALFTVALVVFGLKRRGHGRINRVEGSVLLLAFVAYTAYLLITAM